MAQQKNIGTVENFSDKNVVGEKVCGAPALGAGRRLPHQPNKSLINECKYSIKEACNKMSIGETTLRSMIKNGEIAVLNLGGKYLLLERDIENYLMKNYGIIQQTKVQPNKLPPLPDHIANSDLIRKVG